MNNLHDNDYESIEDPESDRRVDSKNLKFIERLIDKAIKRLEDDSFEPKIQDALKAIQLKEKVAKTSEAEKIFWQEIENIRNEELPKLYPEEAVSLETQIQNTVLGLKDQVKNGTLPVKTITDTFNQGRSKESRLSYRRIGRLLSTMGFRKVKTHDNTCAILWDDKLLSKNGPSDVEKNEKPPSPSPPCPPSPEVTLPAPQVCGWRSS
jgi:hypothetical protein